ncbi:DedA family protein [Frigoribacterium sp. 2-23]|uniref:DedA family protein n=1 Tax=Frigoribacterium sp. 2-23 TaxID=3415006 RepID=UPI003C6ED61D
MTTIAAPLPLFASRPSAAVATTASSSSDGVDDLDGLVGIAARVINALGEWGVGLLTFVETVFPPIPSEIVLPLAGFLSNRGEMSLALLIVVSTLGAYLGGLVLYGLGAWLGLERSIRWLSRLPLVDRDDFDKAAAWFHRHGRAAVFFGRLIPGVRSLISLPAGAERMHLGTFTVFTVAGSGLWNGLLIGLGAALGTQYELIDQYSAYLDYVVYAAIAGIVVWLVLRRVRRSQQARRATGRDVPGESAPTAQDAGPHRP